MHIQSIFVYFYLLCAGCKTICPTGDNKDFGVNQLSLQSCQKMALWAGCNLLYAFCKNWDILLLFSCENSYNVVFVDESYEMISCFLALFSPVTILQL